MSAPAGGGLLQRRVFGVPVLVPILAVAGFVIWRVYKSRSASSSTGSSPADTAAVPTGVGDAAQYYEQQGADLANWLDQQEDATKARKPPTRTPEEEGFRVLANPSAVRAAERLGETIFIRTANGAFTPLRRGTKLPKGTPEYVRNVPARRDQDAPALTNPHGGGPGG